jgi:hypothetical protein
MKQQVLRNPIHTNSTKITVKKRREQWKITIFQNIPEQRQQEIAKYLRNVERGRLRMEHDGADVTRQITSEQIGRFLKCSECIHKPVVVIQFKKSYVGVCAKDWIKLSDTVIGWEGGN